MPHELHKLTPSLVVSSVERSLAYYRDVLGFSVKATVPDAAPYVFAWVESGGISLFLNAPDAAAAEYPSLKERPIGGTLTLFMEVANIRTSYESLKDRIKIVMPLETKWYGMTEFAFEDPDGYIIIFAEREPNA